MLAQNLTRALIPLDLHATLFRGLADPARLALLLHLRRGAQAASELAAVCGLSPSNASNHLQCLLECGLVRVEPRGRHNIYALADPAVAELLDASERALGTGVATLIEACVNYGAPSRRALRPATADTHQRGAGASGRAGGRRR